MMVGRGRITVNKVSWIIDPKPEARSRPCPRPREADFLSFHLATRRPVEHEAEALQLAGNRKRSRGAR